jgi:hypothetical protein
MNRTRAIQVVQALRRQQTASYRAKADELIQKYDITDDELSSTIGGDVVFNLDEYIEWELEDRSGGALFGIYLKLGGIKFDDVVNHVRSIDKMGTKGYLHWGFLIHNAKKCGRKFFADFCNAMKHHPRDTKIKRFNVIGANIRRLYPDREKIPNVMETVYKLASLLPDEYAWVRDDPRFHPGMRTSDIRVILRSPHMGGNYNYVPEERSRSSRTTDSSFMFSGDCIDLDKEELARVYDRLQKMMEEIPGLSVKFSPKFLDAIGVL